MHPVSPERLAKVVELYLEGKTFVEIGKILHIGQKPIQRALKQAKVPSRPSERRPPRKERLQAIADYYRKGYTIEECEGKFHTTYTTVIRALKYAKVSQRPYRWTDKRIDKLVSLYARGWSIAKCAKALDTNSHTARKHLRKRKILLRSHKDSVCRGSACGNWKGGFRVDGDGYYKQRAPFGHPKYPGYVLVSHLVMEKALGRYLKPGEVVHHKDKNKQNNSIDNLQLFSSNGEHLASELAGNCPKWSEEGRKKILEAHRQWCERQRKIRHSKIDGRK